jgi:hypothetical protein
MNGKESEMALTTWNAGGSSVPPDKHVHQGEAKAPEGTGNYSGNVSGAEAAASGGDNSDKAKAIYGTPPSGTRMPRIQSEAVEAQQDTPGWGESNEQPAFIDGSTAGGFKNISGYGFEHDWGSTGLPSHQAASEPGSPGFPGLPDDVTGQGVDVPTKTQGGGRGADAVGRPVSVQGKAGSNPAQAGGPGFPGIEQGY